MQPFRVGSLGTALLVAACTGSSSEPRHGAVLVTLDTTRADALGCYGNERARTPHLDALAAAGVRFERAYTVTPLTLPAHASMLTGLYPPRHTVRSNGPRPLPESASTLAERAAAAGIDTAAFVSAAVLDRRFGLAQGFALYDEPGEQRNERRAGETAARAAEWIRSREGSFLAWVHFFDPHAPYDPPPELASGPLGDTPYLAEVAAVDAAVGMLLAALAECGALERTTIVVVGDHGEALGEHGESTHGSLCHESTVRVPLIVRPPGAGPGRTDERVVSVVDVFPTLLQGLGLPPVAGIDGVDLLADPAQRADGAYFESYNGFVAYGWSPLAGWVDAHGKYVHSSRPQLFDVARDPRETDDLLEGPRSVEAYLDAIDRVAGASALPSGADAVSDPVLLAQIRALGYTDAARDVTDLPHPLAPSDRPAPGSMIHEEQRLHEAGELVAGGNCRRARVLLETLLAANPRNLFALDMLSACLARSGERKAAIRALRRLLAEAPPWPDSWHRLGRLLAEDGERGEAMAAFAAGLRIDPQHGPCRSALSNLHGEPSIGG